MPHTYIGDNKKRTKMKDDSVIQIVLNLNDEIYDMAPNTDAFLYYTTDGITEEVTFLDKTIWDDDNDAREIIEEKGDYESLEKFLRREINRIISELYKIRL